MKTNVHKVLYVCVSDEPDALDLIDTIERCFHCHMSGDRQLLLSLEAISDQCDCTSVPEKFKKALAEIEVEGRMADVGDILVYT